MNSTEEEKKNNMNSTEVSLFVVIDRDILEYIFRKKIDDKDWKEALNDSSEFRYNDILDEASEKLRKTLIYSKNKNSNVKKNR